MTTLRLAAALLLTLFATADAAAEGLLITPHRVVLEGREREAQVTLTNSGTETTTYRLYLVNYRMTREGGFDPVTAPVTWQEGFADQLVRYSPRQVELGAGETQVVRVQARLPAGIATGEYRTHLVFQALPKETGAERLESKQGRTRATINTVYGVSIPVIIRRGKTAATVKLSGLSLQSVNGTPHADFVIERDGNQSVYGNVKVLLRRKDEDQTVGESSGLAVYTPLRERRVAVPLRLGQPVPSKVALVAVFEDETGRELARQSIELR